MKAITAIEKYQKTPQKIMPWSGQLTFELRNRVLSHQQTNAIYLDEELGRKKQNPVKQKQKPS
jgi:hypothetical protein